MQVTMPVTLGPATPAARAPVENTVPVKPLVKAAPSAHDPLLYDSSLKYNDIGLIRQRWRPVKRKLPKKRAMSRNLPEHAQNIGKRVKSETSADAQAIILPAKQKEIVEASDPPPVMAFFSRKHHLPDLPDADHSNENTAVKNTIPVNIANALRENYFAPQVPTAAEDFFHPKHALPSATANRKRHETAGSSGDGGATT